MVKIEEKIVFKGTQTAEFFAVKNDVAHHLQLSAINCDNSLSNVKHFIVRLEKEGYSVENCLKNKGVYLDRNIFNVVMDSFKSINRTFKNIKQSNIFYSDQPGR